MPTGCMPATTTRTPFLPSVSVPLAGRAERSQVSRLKTARSLSRRPIASYRGMVRRWDPGISLLFFDELLLMNFMPGRPGDIDRFLERSIWFRAFHDLHHVLDRTESILLFPHNSTFIRHEMHAIIAIQAEPGACVAENRYINQKRERKTPTQCNNAHSSAPKQNHQRPKAQSDSSPFFAFAFFSACRLSFFFRLRSSLSTAACLPSCSAKASASVSISVSFIFKSSLFSTPSSAS